MSFNPNYVSNLAQAVDRSSYAEQQLTTELSSGLRVSKLSDDPVAASENVQLSASIGRIDSFVQSSARAQGVLQVTDGALGEVVSQVTSALSLAVAASNGTLTASNLKAITQQVSDLRDGIVSLANTSYLGQYLFGGTRGDYPPFTQDNTTTPATTTYIGYPGAQNIQTPDGQNLALGVSGAAVFTAPGANLLGSLNQLVADLGAGNQGALTADSSALSSALSNVSEQRSVIGSALSRLQATTSYAQTQQVGYQVRQSTLLSADLPQVATDVKSAEVQHSALLAVEASLSKVNLFDYVK